MPPNFLDTLKHMSPSLDNGFHMDTHLIEPCPLEDVAGLLAHLMEISPLLERGRSTYLRGR